MRISILNNVIVSKDVLHFPIQDNKLGTDKAVIREMYALITGDISKKASRKLPHHYVRHDGSMVVHEQGLEAAVNALLESRDRVNSMDRKTAAAHLLKHCKDLEPSEKLKDMAKKLEKLVNEEDNLDPYTLGAKPEEDEEDCYPGLSAKEDDDDDEDDKKGKKDSQKVPAEATEDEEECNNPKKGEDEEDEEESKPKSFGDFATMLKQSGFGHTYDAQSDTFVLHYGAKVVGPSLMRPEMGEDESLVKNAFGSKAGNAPEFRPTDEEFKIISRLNNKKYPREAFKVFYTVSSGTALDRHNEQMGKKSLNKMAEYAYDTPLLMDHDYTQSAKVVGKLFDGKVFRSSDGSMRVVHKFFVHDTPENKSIIDGFETGINNKLSVGIRMRRKDYVCNMCNKPMFTMSEDFRAEWCGHMVGMEMKDGKVVTATIADIIDLLELSRVTVPAFKDAAVKSEDGSADELEKSIQDGITNQFEATDAAEKTLTASFVMPVEDQNLAAAKISQEASETNDQVVDKGDSMADEGSERSENEQDALKTVNDAYVSIIANFEQIQQKCFEIMTEQKELNTKISASLDKLTASLETKVEEQKTHAQEMSEREAHFQKQVGETRELLTLQVKALTKFAEDCGMVVKKSTTDIAREIGNSLSMRQTAASAEQKKADGDNFYEDVALKLQRPNGR